MNERIYELAEQAGAYCEVLRGGDYKPPVLDGMNLEKFARLMVAECQSAARSTNVNFVKTTYEKGLVDAAIDRVCQSLDKICTQQGV